MIMEAQLKEIRDKQKESWNTFSPGWKKWDDLTMKFIGPYGDELIRMLDPSGSDNLLDIAAGTGEPGISIAPMLTGGTVTLTDLSEGMLQVAKEKADELGIQNLETSIADACELPFDDGSFDKVSCRFGFMFFPDMQLAATEMARVLRPGGKVATTVWGVPENNFWVTVFVKNIGAHVEMPPPPPGAPGMFRCAEPGLIAGIFSNAGLNNVQEKVVEGTIDCESAEQFWDFMTEIAAPFVAALNSVDQGTREKIQTGVLQDINERYPDARGIRTYGLAVCGEK